MIYYVMQTGNLGVSIDGGKTLFNHVGRMMAVNSAWEETDAEWGDLTIACQEAVYRVESEEDRRIDLEEDERLKAEKAKRGARICRPIEWRYR